jgi:hypothetical protein
MFIICYENDPVVECQFLLPFMAKKQQSDSVL